VGVHQVRPLQRLHRQQATLPRLRLPQPLHRRLLRHRLRLVRRQRQLEAAIASIATPATTR